MLILGSSLDSPRVAAPWTAGLIEGWYCWFPGTKIADWGTLSALCCFWNSWTQGWTFLLKSVFSVWPLHNKFLCQNTCIITDKILAQDLKFENSLGHTSENGDVWFHCVESIPQCRKQKTKQNTKKKKQKKTKQTNKFKFYDNRLKAETTTPWKAFFWKCHLWPFTWHGEEKCPEMFFYLFIWLILKKKVPKGWNMLITWSTFCWPFGQWHNDMGCAVWCKCGQSSLDINTLWTRPGESSARGRTAAVGIPPQNHGFLHRILRQSGDAFSKIYPSLPIG